MNLFQNVKYGVNCREAAERYGVSVNRQGKALCPFHNDQLFLVCRFTKPPSGLQQTSALTRTDRRQRKSLKNADSKQNHSSSWKTSGCALLFCPIMPV